MLSPERDRIFEGQRSRWAALTMAALVPHMIAQDMAEIKHHAADHIHEGFETHIQRNVRCLRDQIFAGHGVVHNQPEG